MRYKVYLILFLSSVFTCIGLIYFKQWNYLMCLISLDVCLILLGFGAVLSQLEAVKVLLEMQNNLLIAILKRGGVEVVPKANEEIKK